MQKYKSSTEKNDYQYSYEENDESKGDNIATENEGVVEYGNDFKNCRTFHDKDST